VERSQLVRPVNKVFHTCLQQRLYAKVVVPVPPLAESLSEGTVKQLAKHVGEYVEQDEEITSIETDKIDVAVNAPEAGTITQWFVSEEDNVEVGQKLCEIDTEGKSSGGSSEPKSEPKQPKQPSEGEKQEKQSSPKETQQSKESQEPPIEEPKSPAAKPSPAQEQPRQPPPKEAAKPAPAPSAAPTPGTREERRVKMTRMRLRIAERLKESQNTAASLTTFNEVDMSSLIEMRSLYKEEVLARTGVKLGFMSAFTKAVVLALKAVPSVNSSIEGNDIVYRDYVDVSVAVATDKGLVTPVVRNAETLDLVGIEKSILELATKAREGKMTLEDMAGGTFTISNGGIYGSLMGTPIINLPQTAVLGLHATKDRPIALKGQVVIRPMMFLALTYDHRLVDGREAVTFLKTIKELIEDPRKMLVV